MKDSKSNSSGKLIYVDVSLKGVTPEVLNAWKIEACPTIDVLAKQFSLSLRNATPVKGLIEIIEDPSDERVFKSAVVSRSRANPNEYTMQFGAGLLVQLSIIARSIAADSTQLKGVTKCELITPEAQKKGRSEVIGDFVFHFMLKFVVMHEFAHIVLGHLDWLDAESGVSMINETEPSPSPDDEYFNRQVLEADADRQASTWTAALIDYAMKSNFDCRYTDNSDLFFDIGYIYGSLFMFLDAIDPDIPSNLRTHPKASVRLGIALTFVETFLKKYYPDSAAALFQMAIEGGLLSLSRVYHEKKKLIDKDEVKAFMLQTGKRLDEMKIRKCSLLFIQGGQPSFNLNTGS